MTLSALSEGVVMKLFLIKIVCLGHAYFEVRAERSSCSAIVHALDRYPQACAVSARPVLAKTGGAA